MNPEKLAGVRKKDIAINMTTVAGESRNPVAITYCRDGGNTSMVAPPGNDLTEPSLGTAVDGVLIGTLPRFSRT